MNENISVFSLVHTQRIPLHLKSPTMLCCYQNAILTLKLTLCVCWEGEGGGSVF